MQHRDSLAIDDRVPSAGAGIAAPSEPHDLRPALWIGQRRYPVELPKLRDPRLHTASVLLTVQVLGQVSLGFELSVAQILASILTCALIETLVVFHRRKVVAWPASAMLTGNGIALIMRAEGTVHGDWWSLHGVWIFVAAAGLAMATKYHIRIGGRHLFNPSNVALVAAFLVLGSRSVSPQDFWWGQMSVGLVLTYAVLLVGGVVITRRLGLFVCAATYWAALAVAVALIASTGHSFTARWSFEPVDGIGLWWVIVTSPEILIFMFFMITDPRTVPSGRVARAVFALTVAMVGAVLLAAQTTEFAAKVAILAGLTAASLLRPAIEHLAPPAGSSEDRVGAWFRAVLGPAHRGAAPPPSHRRWVGWAVLATVAIMLGTAWLSPDPDPSAVTGADRPPVEVDRRPLGNVTVDPSVERLNAEVGDEKVDAIAYDFLASLALEREALESRDPNLAAAASTGARLDQNLELIEAGSLRPSETEIDRLVLTIVRRDPQAVPAFGIEVYSTASMNPREYELALLGGHYVVSAGP